jgi:hypothetical protein
MLNVYEYGNKTEMHQPFLKHDAHALRKHHICITKTTQFLLYCEVIGACSENHTKRVQQSAGKQQCLDVYVAGNC